jgi:hypothetical protein
MFFSQSKEQFSDTRQAIPADHRARAEMSAKCLHLQEVMCQKSTENYSIKEWKKQIVQINQKEYQQTCELRFSKASASVQKSQFTNRKSLAIAALPPRRDHRSPSP